MGMAWVKSFDTYELVLSLYRLVLAQKQHLAWIPVLEPPGLFFVT